MTRSARLVLIAVASLLLVAGGAVWWALARHAPASAASAPAGSAVLHGTVVRFASVEQGRAVLGADDAWVQRTSELQRAVLMGREPPAPSDAFRAYEAGAVLPWTPAAQARWQRALEAIAPALNRLGLPWPPALLLVQTSGRESANQPHTRANAVVLPQQFEQQGFSDAEVLAHELWHVLSRSRPALATRLYALIGYQPVAELRWPARWQAIRLANQDAPLNHHAMRLTLQGRETWVMPVLVVGAEPGERTAGQSLLNLMAPRLLEVQPGAGEQPTEAVLRDGEPVWYEIDTTPEFFQRLGGNTDYTLHPDETIADNLMLLVSGRPVPNPTLLRRIEAALLAVER